MQYFRDFVILCPCCRQDLIMSFRSLHEAERWMGTTLQDGHDTVNILQLGLRN